MLICRCISLLLLFLLFSCAHPHPYTLQDLEKAEDDGYKRGRAGMYSQAELDAEKKKSYEAGYKAGSRGRISEEDYEKMKSQLQAEAVTAKVEKTIELAKQINFFGFDEETGSIPDEVVSHLNEAKRELEEAEQKLKRAETNSSYGYLAEKSVEHADTAFKLRTEIVYYSLIRYHYRLGEKYKERGEREEKQDAYQEAYKIAKQLFENATRIDLQSSLFNDTAYYLAKMGLDFYGDRKLATAEKIYELIKKYRWREKRVLDEIKKLDGKVGD